MLADHSFLCQKERGEIRICWCNYLFIKTIYKIFCTVKTFWNGIKYSRIQAKVSSIHSNRLFLLTEDLMCPCHLCLDLLILGVHSLVYVYVKERATVVSPWTTFRHFCSRNGSFYATFSIETKDKGLQGPHSASATTIQPLKLAPPATQTFNLIKSPL